MLERRSLLLCGGVLCTVQTPEQIRNHDYLQLIGQTHQQYYHSAPTNTHHQSKEKWKYGKTVFLPFKSKFYYFDLGYANSLSRRETVTIVLQVNH